MSKGKESPAHPSILPRYSLAGVHDVPRGALVHALVVVDDMAARLPGVLALVVQLLAEGEGDAAPALEAVVPGGTGVHTPPVQVEVAAGHALVGVVGLRAVPQALAVAALPVRCAALGLAGRGTDCEGKHHRQ